MVANYFGLKPYTELGIFININICFNEYCEIFSLVKSPLIFSNENVWSCEKMFHSTIGLAPPIL